MQNQIWADSLHWRTKSLCSNFIFYSAASHLQSLVLLKADVSLLFPVLSLQNNKVRRFAFELKMQDKSTYLLAADSEAEMEDWINTLNKILHSTFEIAMHEKRNGDVHDGARASVCLSLYFFHSLNVLLLSWFFLDFTFPQTSLNAKLNIDITVLWNFLCSLIGLSLILETISYCKGLPSGIISSKSTDYYQCSRSGILSWCF